jgi:hypothetical protein
MRSATFVPGKLVILGIAHQSVETIGQKTRARRAFAEAIPMLYPSESAQSIRLVAGWR